MGVTYFSAPISWTSYQWYQLALAYSPSNIAFYTNGQLAAVADGRPFIPGGITSLYNVTNMMNSAGSGIYNYPPESVRLLGFKIGNDGSGAQPSGQFEELETFNYPLTAQEIARDFPNFNGAISDVTLDSDYDGRSDLLEDQVDHTDKNDPNSVFPCRLGYWRFNGANWAGEQGQLPKSTNALSVAAGWSSNAVVITGASESRLVYNDVEANGWANFNCRRGCARFWFKPGWNSGTGPGSDAPFLYLGNSDPAVSKWRLGVNGAGNQIAFSTASNSIPGVLFQVSCDQFNSNTWIQIAFNYGPTNLGLYVNGVLCASTGTGIDRYPGLADRAAGLVIGNDIVGSRSILGQFDELETFNYQLTSAEIQRSFPTPDRPFTRDLRSAADSFVPRSFKGQTFPPLMQQVPEEPEVNVLLRM